MREARTAAGMSQADLAERLGVTQAAVAQLERPGANPTLRTLRRVLGATGHRLELGISTPPAGMVDEDQIRERLEMTSHDRLASFDAAYRNVRKAFATR